MRGDVGEVAHGSALGGGKSRMEHDGFKYMYCGVW